MTDWPAQLCFWSTFLTFACVTSSLPIGLKWSPRHRFVLVSNCWLQGHWDWPVCGNKWESVVKRTNTILQSAAQEGRVPTVLCTLWNSSWCTVGVQNILAEWRELGFSCSLPADVLLPHTQWQCPGRCLLPATSLLLLTEGHCVLLTTFALTDTLGFPTKSQKRSEDA